MFYQFICDSPYQLKYRMYTVQQSAKSCSCDMYTVQRMECAMDHGE